LNGSTAKMNCEAAFNKNLGVIDDILDGEL
jgi:hypothetical protein